MTNAPPLCASVQAVTADELLSDSAEAALSPGQFAAIRDNSHTVATALRADCAEVSPGEQTG